MSKSTRKANKAALLLAANAGAAAITYLTVRTLVQTALDRKMPPIMEHNRKRISSADYDMDFIRLAKESSDRLAAQDHESVITYGKDGTILVGHWFPVKNAERVIIAMHGWRSSWSSDFGMISDFWHDNHCSVLYAEQRGQNNSGGDSMGFGMTERFDCLSWIDWVTQHNGVEIPIYLCGVSMGATTVLMSADLDLPKNVHGIMADCGFTSPYDIWKYIANHNLHLPYGINGRLIDFLCERKIQYRSTDCSTIEALKNTNVPVIFAHGKNDHFVPVEMTLQNYEACISPKMLLIVPEADHGMSYYVAKDEYERKVKEFWKAFD